MWFGLDTSLDVVLRLLVVQSLKKQRKRKRPSDFVPFYESVCLPLPLVLCFRFEFSVAGRGASDPSRARHRVPLVRRRKQDSEVPVSDIDHVTQLHVRHPCVSCYQVCI